LLGGTASYGKGCKDMYLVKLDRNGKIEWMKTFGGKKDDFCFHVEQTSDGGYILAGYTSSYGHGDIDAWVVKVDKDGNEEWNKTFGGKKWDRALWVEQTGDGGYIIAGDTMSFSWVDYVFIGWVIKIDRHGNEVWNKTFGWENVAAVLRCIKQTGDGGYVVGGSLYPLTHPNPNEYVVVGSYAWLIRLDEGGNEIWNKTYNDSDRNYEADLIDFDLTRDGGVIMGCYSFTFNGPSDDKALVIKTDGDGNVEWEKRYGTDAYTDVESIQQTPDGGYVFVSQYQLKSYPFVMWLLAPNPMIWLVKLDEDGSEEWNRSFPVIGYWILLESVRVDQAMDGGFVISATLAPLRPIYPMLQKETDIIVLKTDGQGRTKTIQVRFCGIMYLIEKHLGTSSDASQSKLSLSRFTIQPTNHLIFTTTFTSETVNFLT